MAAAALPLVGRATRSEASVMSASATDLLVWRDEFDAPLSLATDNDTGSWRTRGFDDGGSVTTGYVDYAGSSWNISPIQHPTHSPFSVANSILTISAIRRPADMTDVSTNWVGGMLTSNPLAGLTWRFGYFEWRARLRGSARGMFPALWLFSNRAPVVADGKQSAEIDLLEVFGNSAGQPWVSTYHNSPSGTSGTIGNWNDDTSDWHRYGVEWTPDRVVIYRDGLVKGSVTGAAAQWFQGADLGLRMNYAVDPGWETQGSPLRTTASDPEPGHQFAMDIDYVRVFSVLPPLALGSADPLASTTPAAASDVWRLDVGGQQAGTWLTPPASLVVGGTDAGNPGVTIPPRYVPADLFATERWGPQTWTIPVKTTGDVIVKLLFAERYAPCKRPGARVFKVLINGQVAKAGLDAWVAQGSTASGSSVLNFRTQTVNGAVTVQLLPVIDQPFLNGLLVRKL